MESLANKKVFVIGGAGFIGSHLVSQVLQRYDNASVTVYDSFSSGQMRHLEQFANDTRLSIIKNDVKNLTDLTSAMQGHHVVFHFASNPDIAKAATQPDIDFWEGTYLTQNVLEAMRVNQIKQLIYPSGSGVYGDTGDQPVHELFSPMLPISTYGASKLAGESLICAYCHMFNIHAAVFRFANVVGPNQTHGVAYDFVRRLSKDPSHLTILGDGRQSKSYVYVDDVISALLMIYQQGLQGYDYFNIATEDYITVKDIADLVVNRMKLSAVRYEYTGGDRGWKGDVPIVRFNTDKIRNKGWKNQKTSAQAMMASIDSIIQEVTAECAV